MADPVSIIDYDPNWPVAFAALAERAARVFKAPPAIPAVMEHVGSTAVPGLSAKPIIDIDVIVASEHVGDAIARLSRLGYVHEGDGGLPGREALRWPPNDTRHHLYVCRPDTPACREHIIFRDHLRRHSNVAAAYGALKRQLATEHAQDRSTYQAGKRAFIENVLRTASGRQPPSAAAFDGWIPFSGGMRGEGQR